MTLTAEDPNIIVRQLLTAEHLFELGNSADLERYTRQDTPEIRRLFAHTVTPFFSENLPMFTSGYKVAWSPNGEYVCFGSTGGNRSVIVYNIRMRAHSLYLNHPESDDISQQPNIAWSKDGQLLAIEGMHSVARIYTPDNYNPLCILKFGEYHSGGIPIWSTTNPTTLITIFGQYIILWNNLDRPVARATFHKGVESHAWSPDGVHLATGDAQETRGATEETKAPEPERYEKTYLTRIRSAKTLKTATNLGEGELGHKGKIYSISWHPNSKILATGSADRTAKIWDIRHGGQLKYTLEGHADAVYQVKFAPNGSLATTSWDGTAKIWNSRGRCLHTLTGHTKPINSISWNHDGSLFASGSGDESVKIWNPRNGHLIETIPIKGAAFDVEWAPEKNLLAVASRRGFTVIDYDVEPLPLPQQLLLYKLNKSEGIISQRKAQNLLPIYHDLPEPARLFVDSLTDGFLSATIPPVAEEAEEEEEKKEAAARPGRVRDLIKHWAGGRVGQTKPKKKPPLCRKPRTCNPLVEMFQKRLADLNAEYEKLQQDFVDIKEKVNISRNAHKRL